MKKAIIICLSILLNFYTAKACNYTASFSGAAMVCAGSSFNYLTKPTSGHYYRWVVSGGSIVYGQGKDSLWVNWPAPGSGSVQLFDSTSSCVSSATKTILVGPSTGYLTQTKFNQEGDVTYTTPKGRTYTVTSKGSQTYAAWNQNEINLESNFDFSFITFQDNSYQPAGDGIMFVIQNAGNTIGPGAGEGALGYYNDKSGEMNESIGIEEDIFNSGPLTYYDSSGSHLNLVIDGSPTPIRPQVNILPTIANGTNRKIRITWNKDVNLFEVYFDGVKRFSWHNDIIKNVFGGNPNVWFGFTGSTSNVEAAIQTFAADTLIYNQAIINASADTVCVGDSVTLTSSQGASYLWSNGARTRSIKVAKPGVYSVTVTDNFNCESTAIDSFDLVVLQPVSAAFTVSDICLSSPVSITNNTTPSTGVRFMWHFGNGDSASGKIPLYYYKAIGTYHITVNATNGGCTSTATQPVTVYSHPGGIIVSKGVPFQGQFNSGDRTRTDYACVGDTSTYQFSSPSGYSDSDYGSKWIISSKTFTTASGTINTDTVFKNPTTSQDAYFRFFPNAAFSDSILILTLHIKLISSNCDTVITRYIQVRPNVTSRFASTNACLGLPVSFNDHSTFGSDSASNWNWDFGDGTSSTLQNPNHSFANPGAYKVTLTATSKEGCGIPVTQSVTQYPNPVAGFHEATVCQNESSAFTDSSSISSGSITAHTWNFGNGAISSQTNPLYTYSKSGPYPVKLVVTSSFGCTDTVTKTVRVEPSPVAGFAYKNACVGSLIYFSNKSTDSTPGTRYLWNFGDGHTSTSALPTNTYAVNGAYNVALTASTKYGCMNTSDQKITPYPKPVPNIVYSGSCINDAIAFGDSDNNERGDTYSWNFGDGSSDVKTTNKDSNTYTNAGAYKVILTIQNATGCIDTGSRIVQISTYPVASFFTTNFCEGNPIFFNSTSNGAGLKYSWNFGDNASGKYNYSTAQNPIHVFDTAGVYSAILSVTNSGGCTDALTQNVKVLVSPLGGRWNYQINNQTVTFTPQDTTQKTYEWYFGTGDSTSVTKPIYTYQSDGKYLVELIETNADGCYSTNSDSINIGNLGLESVSGPPNNLHIGIFPNPFENKTNISYTLTANSEVNVSIYDIQGKLVAELRDGNFGSGKYQEEFDASKYNALAGIYLLKITINGEVFTGRIEEMK